MFNKIFGAGIVISLSLWMLAMCVGQAYADTVYLPVVQGGDGTWASVPSPTPTSTPTATPDPAWAAQVDVWDYAVNGQPLPFYIPTAEEWCGEPTAWIVDVVRKGALLDICGEDPTAPATTRDWKNLVGSGWDVSEALVMELKIRDDGQQYVPIVAGKNECTQEGDTIACSLRMETLHIGWPSQYWEMVQPPAYLPTPTPEAMGGPVGEPTPNQ